MLPFTININLGSLERFCEKDCNIRLITTEMEQTREPESSVDTKRRFAFDNNNGNNSRNNSRNNPRNNRRLILLTFKKVIYGIK